MDDIGDEYFECRFCSNVEPLQSEGVVCDDSGCYCCVEHLKLFHNEKEVRI